MTAIQLRSRHLDSAGAGINALTVEVYATDANGLPTGAAVASTTTNANGVWEFLAATGLLHSTRYCVKIINGAEVMWLDGSDMIQAEELAVRTQLVLPDGTAMTSTVTPIKHQLATAASDFLVASGVGVFIKKTLAEVKTLLGIPTGEVYVAAVTENVVNDVDPGGVAWTDLDLTAQTSATATRVLLALRLMNETRAARLMLRPNGSGATGVSVDAIYSPAAGAYGFGQAICGLDAGQVLEYGTQDIAGDVEHVWISVIGYWQPAT